ncbi:MAG: CocE/NonD family hydrolase, partial [Waterburya sp.]
SILDCRSDILTYTSAPLESDLLIVGTITLEVYYTTDKPSFDLCAVLSTVNSGSKVFNFTQGYIRVTSADLDAALVKIPLQATCMCLAAGESLRLSLSAACFPAYPVNPGTGKLPHESRLIDQSIITLSIHSGSDYPSRLIIDK